MRFPFRIVGCCFLGAAVWCSAHLSAAPCTVCCVGTYCFGRKVANVVYNYMVVSGTACYRQMNNDVDTLHVCGGDNTVTVKSSTGTGVCYPWDAGSDYINNGSSCSMPTGEPWLWGDCCQRCDAI
jgi:hypothetical protein